MPRVREENVELRDEIRQMLFDTFDLANGVSPATISNSFFSAVQGKPRSQTNLRQNNMLEATVSFRILGMQLDAQNIYAANIGSLGLIQENSFLELRVGEKIYWTGNTSYVTGRLDQQASAATTVAATTINNVYQRYANALPQGIVLSGKHVIDVPPLQSFRVDFGVEGLSAAEVTTSTPSAGAGTKIRFLLSLKGLLRRPVQ